MSPSGRTGTPEGHRTIVGTLLLVVVASSPIFVGHGGPSPGLPVVGPPSAVVSAGSPTGLPPSGSVGAIQITLHNALGAATGPYQQLVQINSSAYADLINSNWTNGEAYNTYDGSPVYAWLEANASNASNDTLLWLKLPSTPANGWTNVSIGFWPKGSFELSSTGYMGEAPELSSTYGQFDNGANVFNFYDNFARSTLSNAWTVLGSWSYSVRNGFNVSSVPGSGGGIYTKSTFSYPSVSDFYGDIFQPTTATAFISEGLGTSGCTSCGSADAVAFNSQGSSFSDGPTPQAGYGSSQTFGASVASTQRFGVFTCEAISTSKAVYQFNYSATQTLTTNIPPSPIPVGLGESGNPAGSLTNTETTQWIRERTYEAQMPSVAFSPMYLVNFTETGLAPGTTWAVNLSGAVQSSASATIGFLELNGSYSYQVEPLGGYTVLPMSGPLTVGGANQTIDLTFTRVTYGVTFSEIGLPMGTTWSVNLSGLLLRSSTATITAREPNGTYPYAIGRSPGWALRGPLTYNGSLTVSAGPVFQTIAWDRVTYAVSFTESGLPTGTGWWLNVSGSPSAFSNGIAIFANEPNGSYPYSVASTDRTFAAPPGTLTVDGSAAQARVAFSRVTFAVTFTELGLPPGTSWWVNVTGSPAATSNTSRISILEANGSYPYSVASANATFAAPDGVLTINGAAAGESVPFSPVTFAVTFAETGLPSGVLWSIVLGGTSKMGVGRLVLTRLVNGTYAYSVSSPSGYVASPSNGSITIDGMAAVEEITFRATPSSPSLLGLPGEEGVIVLGGVVAAALAGGGGVVLWRRRRKSGPPGAGPVRPR